VRVARHRNQPVVADGLFPFRALQDFQHANDLTLEHEARRGRGIVQDESVNRVAVVALGGRDETPVIRIGQSEDQRLGESEDLKLRIVFEFGR